MPACRGVITIPNSRNWRSGDQDEAHLYRTHDIRRGHPPDLQESGSSLAEILAAGQRRSPAFLDYIDAHKLEADVVLHAHMDESSDDEAENTLPTVHNHHADSDHDSGL